MTTYIAPFHTPDFSGDTDPRVAFENLGMNTGNLIFEESIRAQIEHASSLSLSKLHARREELRPEKIVIPSSTFLNPAADLEYFARLIDDLNSEIVLVGVGVHLGSHRPVGEFSSSMKAGTKRFFDIVAERSQLIGCRGDYSADVLEAMGYKNVQIVGCPSIYNWSPPQFREYADNYCLTVEPYSKTAGKLFQLAMRNDCDVIMQTKWEMIDDDLGRSVADFCNLYRLDHKLSSSIVEFYSKRCKLFTNSSDWKDFLKCQSLVIGSRFHGNALALQCGIPALWISHDVRLKELCSYFSLPQVDEDFILSSDPSASTLMNLADYTQFLEEIPKKTASYREFLNQNGLVIAPDSNIRSQET